MINKVIKVTIFAVMNILGYVHAQPVHEQQKTFLVNPGDRNKVHDFHEYIKVKIENHRAKLHVKKELIDNEKETLKNEVKLARENNNGKLSETQKIEFKAKIESIENKTYELKKENSDFISAIDKERQQFFSSIKNKQEN